MSRFSIYYFPSMIKKTLKYIKDQGNRKSEEVIFIATKYKDKPVNIHFYTETGRHVPAKSVSRTESDKKGIRFFTTTPL